MALPSAEEFRKHLKEIEEREKRKKNSLSSSTQTQSQRTSPQRRISISRNRDSDFADKTWALTPYFVTKGKFNADDSDIGPYNGAGLRLKKDIGNRLSVYGKFELDKAEDHRNTGTSYAELRSTGYTSGLGAEVDILRNNRVKVKGYVEGLVRVEDNDGYLQVGGALRPIDESETIPGYGVGVRVESNPNKKVNLFLSGGVEKAGEKDTGYTVSGGFSVQY